MDRERHMRFFIRMRFIFARWTQCMIACVLILALPKVLSAQSTLTGQWTGTGKLLSIQLEMIGCTEQQCYLTVDLKSLDKKETFSDAISGVVRFKPKMELTWDDLNRMSYVADLALDKDQPVLTLKRCNPGCKNNTDFFSDSPEVIRLSKTSSEPSFKPSFDCKNATKDFEGYICRTKRFADLDRDLNFEMQESLLYSKTPLAKNNLVNNQTLWNRQWVKKCEKSPENHWQKCFDVMDKRLSVIQKHKRKTANCTDIQSGFQSILCTDDALRRDITSWNETMSKLEALRLKNKSGGYSSAIYGWFKSMDRLQCYGLLDLNQLKTCIVNLLKADRERLESAKVSQKDWKWMLRCEGSTINDIAFDAAFTDVLKHQFGGHISVTLRRMSLPEGPVRIRDQRYIWIDGATPHDATEKGYFWIDIASKIVIYGGGREGGGVWPCAKNIASEKALPEAFLLDYREWLKSHCADEGPTVFPR